MNRLKKLSIIVMVVFVVIAIQIAPAGAAMSNAIIKYNNINSMTNSTDLTINIAASGLSSEDKDNFDMVQSIINNLKISAVTKLVKTPDNKKMDEYLHLMTNIGGTPINTSIWTKSDLTGKTPIMKEIIRVPSMFSDFMPTGAKGKEYAVLDMSKQTNSAQSADKLAAASTKLTAAITNSIGSFSPGLLLIKDRGTGTLKNQAGTINVHNYTLTLNDATLKSLMKYSVNNLANDKDVITALKEYLIAINSANDNEAKDLSTQFDKEVPNFIKDFNASMNDMKNTKLVGKKGIVINYSINKDGYIVNANGVVDLLFGASMLNEAASTINQTKTSKAMGTYNLTLRFNSNMYNINSGTKITFPYLDKNNSFDALKVMDDTNL
jgi:hypothetical protein